MSTLIDITNKPARARNSKVDGDPWHGSDVLRAVAMYFEMLALHRDGKLGRGEGKTTKTSLYQKAAKDSSDEAVARGEAPRTTKVGEETVTYYGRHDGSFEKKLQNISALLLGNDKPSRARGPAFEGLAPQYFVPGLSPLYHGQLNGDLGLVALVTTYVRAQERADRAA